MTFQVCSPLSLSISFSDILSIFRTLFVHITISNADMIVRICNLIFLRVNNFPKVRLHSCIFDYGNDLFAAFYK